MKAGLYVARIADLYGDERAVLFSDLAELQSHLNDCRLDITNVSKIERIFCDLTGSVRAGTSSHIHVDLSRGAL